MEKPREESQILEDLATLAASPGYVHAVARICHRDNVIHIEGKLKSSDMDRLFSRERLIRDLVQIAVVIEEVNFNRIAYWAERTTSQTVGVAASFRSTVARLNWPLRIRWISSIPEIVVAALLNRLKPSMTFVRDLMLRWSCSIKLFKYFEDLTSVSAGSKPSALISRTTRCEAV